MSAAFTHGGLDRTSPTWAGIDIDERDSSDSQGRSGREPASAGAVIPLLFTVELTETQFSGKTSSWRQIWLKSRA